MSCSELFLLAVGLAMDAFAVSMTNGLCCSNLQKGRMLTVAICFGSFQGLMPTTGFFLGKAFESYITALDHYIALILLCCIGGKMLFDALANRNKSETGYVLTTGLLLTQGFATSIDALAVGVSLAALPGVQILPAALSITGITFVLALAGISIGKRFGSRLGSHALAAGGLILIGIGVKIFAEHMFFS